MHLRISDASKHGSSNPPVQASAPCHGIQGYLPLDLESVGLGFPAWRLNSREPMHPYGRSDSISMHPEGPTRRIRKCADLAHDTRPSMSIRIQQVPRTLGSIALSGLLTSCTVFGIRSGYEEAAHAVLLEDDAFELRKYDDALVARTVTTGEYGQAGSAAFRRLGGYIFGKNQSRESVAMTTPVFREASSAKSQSESIAMTTPVLQQELEGGWMSTFVLPSEYTLETLPIPNDPEVEISRLPGAKVAVVRYSGFISPKSIAKHTERLQAWLTERGLTAISAPRSAAYDPPWTIPFFRRNEVHIEVE